MAKYFPSFSGIKKSSFFWINAKKGPNGKFYRDSNDPTTAIKINKKFMISLIDPTSPNECLMAKPSVGDSQFEIMDYDCKQKLTAFCEPPLPQRATTTSTTPKTTSTSAATSTVAPSKYWAETSYKMMPKYYSGTSPVFYNKTVLPNFNCFLPQQFRRQKRSTLARILSSQSGSRKMFSFR